MDIIDVIHTDAPLMPLSQLVGEYGRVQIGTDAPGTHKDCFYGWVEAQSGPACRSHHLVVVHDPDYLMIVAEAIAAAGHQVVVTDFDDWSENQRVLAYDDDHQH